VPDVHDTVAHQRAPAPSLVRVEVEHRQRAGERAGKEHRQRPAVDARGGLRGAAPRFAPTHAPRAARQADGDGSPEGPAVATAVSEADQAVGGEEYVQHGVPPCPHILGLGRSSVYSQMGGPSGTAVPSMTDGTRPCAARPI
jgi:hypothetical protein